MFVSVSAWFGFIDAAIEASWRMIAHIKFQGEYRPWVRENNKKFRYSHAVPLGGRIERAGQGKHFARFKYFLFIKSLNL